METRGLVERDPTHLLTVYDPGRPKQRLGKLGDGGYVIATGFEYDFFISCGIANEFDFDTDFVTQYKVSGAAFDGTVNRPVGFPAQIEFTRKNIGVNGGEENLQTLLEAHANVFLKMDIEGGEWAWLNAMPERLLANVKQFALELHGLWDDSWLATRADKVTALQKLTRTHRIIHAHGNNNGAVIPAAAPGVAATPTVIEITLLRVDLCGTALNTAPLPAAGLDFDNELVGFRMDHRGWPFTHAQAVPMPPHIPRRIYQTWKTRALPPAVTEVRQKAMALNPTYEFELFDDIAMEQFFRKEFAELYPYYLQLQVGAARADLWRYAILYKRGGIYLDIDSDLRAPLDELIGPSDDMIVTREGNPGLFCQWVLIASAQHPVIRILLNQCVANIAAAPRQVYSGATNTGPGSLVTLTGPIVFSQLLQQLWGNMYDQPDRIYAGRDAGKPFALRVYDVDLGSFAAYHHGAAPTLYSATDHWSTTQRTRPTVGYNGALMVYSIREPKIKKGVYTVVDFAQTDIQTDIYVDSWKTLVPPNPSAPRSDKQIIAQLCGFWDDSELSAADKFSALVSLATTHVLVHCDSQDDTIKNLTLTFVRRDAVTVTGLNTAQLVPDAQHPLNGWPFVTK